MDEIPHKGEDPGPIVGDDFEAALEGADGDGPDPDDGPEKPAPEKQPEKETEAEPDPEPEAPPSDSKELLSKLDQMLEALKKRGTDEPEKETEVEVEVPAFLKPLLEHDDPEVQQAARALLDEHTATNARLAKLEERDAEQAVLRIADAIDQDIEAVGKKCDPPLTESEKSVVVDYMIGRMNRPGEKSQDPIAFADGVQAVYPGRLKAVAKEAPAAAGKKPAEGERPVVKVPDQRPDKTRVIDPRGAGGGSPARQPKSNESISQTVDRVFDEAGFK